MCWCFHPGYNQRVNRYDFMILSAKGCLDLGTDRSIPEKSRYNITRDNVLFSLNFLFIGIDIASNRMPQYQGL